MTKDHPLCTTSVNPVRNNDIKRSLRCRKNDNIVKQLEDAALLREEDKLIDEEITSVESNLLDRYDIDDDEKVEHEMLKIALLESVKEKKGVAPKCTGTTDQSQGPRSGLRKRRRPSVKHSSLAVVDPPGGNVGVPVALTQSIASNPNLVLPAPVVVPKQAKRRLKVADPKQLKVEKISSFQNTPPRSTLSSFSDTSPVPNPLSIPIKPPPPLLPTSTDSFQPPPPINPGTLLSRNVPCPIPLNDFDMPMSQDFAAMVDQSAFDIVENRPKVTFSEPCETSSRDRAFSIDLDLFADDQPGDGMFLNLNGRGRAYSFECFAFGISGDGGDEPLPPLDQSVSCSTSYPSRPRGDSIIFDPSSFQDGGIHEQTALERTSLAQINSVHNLVDNVLMDVPSTPDILPDLISSTGAAPGTSRTALPTSTLFPTAPPSKLPSNMVPIDDNAKSTHSSASPVERSSASILASGSIPYEILNKDGRIGIYLPDARRARIARFHSKRSKRIWRKRIKYDCRKKLADSRPRIKGRFVKRVDED